MKSIAKAILVVGLAWVSAYALIASNGEIGIGWGILAVLILFFG